MFFYFLLLLGVAFATSQNLSIEGDVRLAYINQNGNEVRGMVEYFHNGEWGTICDDRWDSLDAQVVCTQLGYFGAVAPLQNSLAGQGVHNIWLTDVGCTEDDVALVNCTKIFEPSHCDHGEDAGVICQIEVIDVVPVINEDTLNSCNNQVTLRNQSLTSECVSLPVTHYGFEICEEDGELNYCSVSWVTFQEVCRVVTTNYFQSTWNCCEGYFWNSTFCLPMCETPCINGECVQPNTCECDLGFAGVDCSIQENDCLCENGGKCKSTVQDCICPNGFYGNLCQQTCPSNFGPGCAYDCLCNVNSTQTCDSVTGKCECLDGYEGSQCSLHCPISGCNATACKCHNNGVCNETDESCLCPAGWTGVYCAEPCPATYYGTNCQFPCPTCFNNGECNRFTGKCDCAAIFTGDQCEFALSCESPFTYGINCSNSCPCQNDSPGCDPITGVCVCSNGYYGELCELKICSLGKFGKYCNDTCSCENGSLCNSTDGSCICLSGFTGITCNETCPVGYYGLGCSFKCLSCSVESCHPITGCPADPLLTFDECSSIVTQSLGPLDPTSIATDDEFCYILTLSSESACGSPWNNNSLTTWPICSSLILSALNQSSNDSQLSCTEMSENIVCPELTSLQDLNIQTVVLAVKDLINSTSWNQIQITNLVLAEIIRAISSENESAVENAFSSDFVNHEILSEALFIAKNQCRNCSFELPIYREKFQRILDDYITVNSTNVVSENDSSAINFLLEPFLSETIDLCKSYIDLSIASTINDCLDIYSQDFSHFLSTKLSQRQRRSMNENLLITALQRDTINARAEQSAEECILIVKEKSENISTIHAEQLSAFLNLISALAKEAVSNSSCSDADLGNCETDIVSYGISHESASLFCQFLNIAKYNCISAGNSSNTCGIISNSHILELLNRMSDNPSKIMFDCQSNPYTLFPLCMTTCPDDVRQAAISLSSLLIAHNVTINNLTITQSLSSQLSNVLNAAIRDNVNSQLLNVPVNDSSLCKEDENTSVCEAINDLKSLLNNCSTISFEEFYSYTNNFRTAIVNDFASINKTQVNETLINRLDELSQSVIIDVTKELLISSDILNQINPSVLLSATLQSLKDNKVNLSNTDRESLVLILSHNNLMPDICLDPLMGNYTCLLKGESSTVTNVKNSTLNNMLLMAFIIVSVLFLITLIILLSKLAHLERKKLLAHYYENQIQRNILSENSSASNGIAQLSSVTPRSSSSDVTLLNVSSANGKPPEETTDSNGIFKKLPKQRAETNKMATDHPSNKTLQSQQTKSDSENIERAETSSNNLHSFSRHQIERLDSLTEQAKSELLLTQPKPESENLLPPPPAKGILKNNLLTDKLPPVATTTSVNDSSYIF